MIIREVIGKKLFVSFYSNNLNWNKTYENLETTDFDIENDIRTDAHKFIKQLNWEENPPN